MALVTGFTGRSQVLKGDKELERRLKRLTGKELKEAVKRGARGAMAPMAATARKIVRNEADEGSGYFAKHIGTKVKSYQRGAVVVAMTGALNKKDPETGENPSIIAHLLEFGTGAHPIDGVVLSNIDDPRLDFSDTAEAQVFGKEVMHLGTDGMHMFERSFRQNHQKSARLYQSAINKAIDRIAKKLGTKL